MWHTEPAPAAVHHFRLPDHEARKTHYEIQIPWLLGLIATRSFTHGDPGIIDLANERRKAHRQRHRGLRRRCRGCARNPPRRREQAASTRRQSDLGYALLLKRYVAIRRGDAGADRTRGWDTVPNVPVLFWAFRIMVGSGLYFIALFAVSFMSRPARA